MWKTCGFVMCFVGAVAIVGKTRREIVEDMHDASTEGIGICPNCGTPCEPEDMFCDDGAEEDVSERRALALSVDFHVNTHRTLFTRSLSATFFSQRRTFCDPATIATLPLVLCERVSCLHPVIFFQHVSCLHLSLRRSPAHPSSLHRSRKI